MLPKINRRQFVSTGTALAVFGAAPVRGADWEVLHATTSKIQLLPNEYGQTQIWGFDGKAPGPEIWVKQGARVQKRLVNDLPDATSVHWHGIRIDNAMDGVSGLTQRAITPGTAFDYDFVVPDAGTYWYHAHNRSYEQVARGLHGALVVKEPEEIDVDRDEVLVIDDWLIDPETAQIAGNFGAMHDLSHAGRLGNYVTTNGSYNLSMVVQQHQRLRLRLINASNARVFQLALSGLEGWVVALDGMPVPKPRAIENSFLLAPAQRIDLLVDVIAEVGQAGHLVQVDRGESYSQVAFEVNGSATRSRRSVPEPLPPNAYVKPDLENARALQLVMEGGAMGGLRRATMDGRMVSMSEIAQSGNFWAFNGTVGKMHGEPLGELARGETVRLTIENDTAFPHAMHLHGVHFHEVAGDGTLGAFRDTTLIERGESRDIIFVAENPGKWLLHCHMLSHSVSGMMTWFDVA